MSVWQDRRVVMCMGTGGVGKTTVAATLGLAAAASGLRTLVMTIDPARRLANALGLQSIGNMETEIPPDLLTPLGVRLQAPLWVMMPDVKRTFDDLIERYAPSAEHLHRILNNRFYQQFSTLLAGSLEYAAVEKLYEVHTSGRYDLIVLDTPPSRQAVDFLEAPGKILDFLEHDTLKLLLRPYTLAGKFSLKLFDLGSSFVLSTLGRLAGSDTLRELADFIFGFQGMYDGFRDRSQGIRQLLQSDALAIVLVTAPASRQIEMVTAFRQELHHEGLHVRALVVNRVRRNPYDGIDRPAAESALRAALGNDGAAIIRVLGDEAAWAQQGEARLREVDQAFADTEIVRLPELPVDVHDLESLARLHRQFL